MDWRWASRDSTTKEFSNNKQTNKSALTDGLWNQNWFAIKVKIGGDWWLEKKLKISRGGKRKDGVGIGDRLIRKIGSHAQKIWCINQLFHDKQILGIVEWVAKTEEWKKSLDIKH